MYSLPFSVMFILKDDSLFLCIFTLPSGLAAVLVKAVKFYIQLNTGHLNTVTVLRRLSTTVFHITGIQETL